MTRDVLRGTLGPLVDELPQDLDDHPSHGRGSAFSGIAWYGYVGTAMSSRISPGMATGTDKSADTICPVTTGVVATPPIDWQNRPTFQQVVRFRS